MSRREHWVYRKCENCGKDFWFRKCYAKRPGTPGRFCSNPCKISKLTGVYNPNISELGRRFGPKKAKQYKQKERYQAIRLGALQKLTGASVPKCDRCGCDFFKVLEVNHIYGGGRARNECGTKLHRLVLSLPLEVALDHFNVLCKVCNQADYVERFFGVRHVIMWGKKTAICA